MRRIITLGWLVACSGDIVTAEGRFAAQERGLSEGGPVDACRPAEPPRFSVDDYGDGWTFAADFHLPSWDIRFGARGLVVADFDGDGWVDLLVPQTHEPARVLRGRPGGGFVLDPNPVLVRGAVGGSAADIDGDGDLDAFLYGQADPRRELMPGEVEPPALLVNRGDGSFVVEPRPEWEAGFLGCGGSASWADVDLDGDLDLYFGRLGRVQEGAYSPCESKFLLNDGAGGLVDASDTLPPDAQAIRVMASGFHQFDEDPEPELYLVADALFENAPPEVEVPVAGNLLLDWSGSAWELVPSTGLELVIAGMGLGAADLNDDGLTDVAVPDVGQVPTLLSGGGAWTDIADSVGLVPSRDAGQSVAWGGEFADVDNDGRLDLAITYGAIPGSRSFRQPDELYRDTGSGFAPAGASWGYDDERPNRGVITADVDRDGSIDLITREIGGHVLVHRGLCAEGAWLGIDLVQAGANPHAVGAKVVVTSGQDRFVRWVTAGSTSFSSGGPPSLHVGVGMRRRVDSIVVIWPDGTGQAWRGVPTRQHLVITRQ